MLDNVEKTYNGVAGLLVAGVETPGLLDVVGQTLAGRVYETVVRRRDLVAEVGRLAVERRRPPDQVAGRGLRLPGLEEVLSVDVRVGVIPKPQAVRQETGQEPIAGTLAT